MPPGAVKTWGVRSEAEVLGKVRGKVQEVSFRMLPEGFWSGFFCCCCFRPECCCTWTRTYRTKHNLQDSPLDLRSSVSSALLSSSSSTSSFPSSHFFFPEPQSRDLNEDECEESIYSIFPPSGWGFVSAPQLARQLGESSSKAALLHTPVSLQAAKGYRRRCERNALEWETCAA